MDLLTIVSALEQALTGDTAVLIAQVLLVLAACAIAAWDWWGRRIKGDYLQRKEDDKEVK